MAESLSEIFERLLQKQQMLVERYHVLEGKYAALGKEKSELESELSNREKAIEKLQMENQYLKVVKMVAPDKEALEKSRKIIAKLVRDVEKCIEQLEN